MAEARFKIFIVVGVQKLPIIKSSKLIIIRESSFNNNKGGDEDIETRSLKF